MPITFSQLLGDETLHIKNRRDIRRVYDAAKAAVREERLTLEGHSLPESLNTWIARVEGGDKLPKTDTDVVDFSFADDAALSEFRASLRPTPPQPKRTLTQEARDLLESLQALQTANAHSLGMTNGKKDDVLAALSDLQGAVYTFLDTYDGAQAALKLPERALELSQVQVRKTKPSALSRQPSATN